MASIVQINANRSNAQKSTGPRTAEGKAVVAQNAVKHGLLSRAAVLHGEDWEEYTIFHEEMMNELQPDGVQEEELAERIVDLSWRLRRARRYQNAVFEALYDQYVAESAEAEARPEADTGGLVPSDPVLGRMLLADFSGERVLERVLLYERRIENSLSRVRTELRSLKRERRDGAPNAEFRVWDPREVGRGRPTLDQVEGGLYEESPRGTGTNTPDDQEQFGETKPIGGEVSSGECQVSREPCLVMSSPGLSASGFALETAAELPDGTNPISATMPIGRSAFPGGPGVQNKANRR